jgi:hypothetical protein
VDVHEHEIEDAFGAGTPQVLDTIVGLDHAVAAGLEGTTDLTPERCRVVDEEDTIRI